MWAFAGQEGKKISTKSYHDEFLATNYFKNIFAIEVFRNVVKQEQITHVNLNICTFPAIL